MSHIDAEVCDMINDNSSIVFTPFIQSLEVIP